MPRRAPWIARSRHHRSTLLGYAPGGNLRGHLAGLGYPFDLLLDTGLINSQGRDALCRVIFPCSQRGRIVNFYGRSIGGPFPTHRLRPR